MVILDYKGQNAALICALIAFVLDAIEGIKREKFIYIIGLLGMAVERVEFYDEDM